jgi:hypothetical protein
MPEQNETSEIIYNWNCNTVDVYPTQGEFNNIIYRVHYIVRGGIDYSTNAITATKIGTVILNTNNVTNFIPFNELTSEQTIAWTKATLGEVEVLAIETYIANQIELLRNPVSITMVVPDPPHEAPILPIIPAID